MLQFRDVKQGYPVYILDRQKFEVTQGKVTSAGFPRLESNPAAGKTQMVVDVAIDDGDGRTASYVIPEALSVTYAGDLVLSTERAGLVGEVEAMASEAQKALSLAERHRAVVDKAPELLAELDTEHKAARETDRRLTVLEGTLGEMREMMKRMLDGANS